jgi:hypothetical protein
LQKVDETAVGSEQMDRGTAVRGAVDVVDRGR